MLFYFILTLAALAIIALAAHRPRPTPTHCRCKRRADIFDHHRPWIVWCARCWLKKEGKG